MSIDNAPPVGTTYHREFRDLDKSRLPSAPPRPGQSGQEKPMNKTQTIIYYLKAHATDTASAMKPAEIGHALGGEAAGLDASTTAALLRCAYQGNSALNLRREKRGMAFYWYWGEPRTLGAVEPPNSEPGAIEPKDSGAELQKAIDEGVPGDDAADALLAAIEQVPTGATIPNAEIHAKRLRKLARLPWVVDEVSNWLYQLADLVEGGAQ